MRLVTYTQEGFPRAGIMVGDAIVPAAAVAGQGDVDAHSVVSILEAGADAWRALAAAAQAADGAIPLDEVDLAPPVPAPKKIICVGANYRAHIGEAHEIDGMPANDPPSPILFAKFTTSLLAHDGTVLIPPATAKVDWEAELAVVIGRRATRVTLDDALSYVGGYTALNDVSARDLQSAASQWTVGKACDTFAPCGPWVVTADEIPDPQQLRVQARVNGETMQDDTTAAMIFTVARLIEYITSVITLEPGDIIATGTPHGVGVGRNPPVFLKPGDEVEVEVEGIGVLRNSFAAAPAAPGATRPSSAVAA